MIEKLIAQYKQKIAEQDLLIDELTTVVRNYRKDDELPGYYDYIGEVLAMRKGKLALKQAYVQFIYELKEVV